MLGDKAGTCFRPTYVAAHRSRLEEIYVWIQIGSLVRSIDNEAAMPGQCEDHGTY